MRVVADSKFNANTISEWVKDYHPLLLHARKVVVIGCGSGAYLTEILNQFPDMVIEVIEFDEEKFKVWQIKDPRGKNSQQVGLVTAQSASRNCLVMDCKAAWEGHEIDYALVSAELRETGLGNIKNICQQLKIEDQSPEAKIWRSLREMVR